MPDTPGPTDQPTATATKYHHQPPTNINEVGAPNNINLEDEDYEYDSGQENTLEVTDASWFTAAI